TTNQTAIFVPKATVFYGPSGNATHLNTNHAALGDLTSTLGLWLDPAAWPQLSTAQFRNICTEVHSTPAATLPPVLGDPSSRLFRSRQSPVFDGAFAIPPKKASWLSQDGLSTLSGIWAVVLHFCFFYDGTPRHGRCPPSPRPDNATSLTVQFTRPLQESPNHNLP
ncbi:hypothetical protein CPAR01_06072, partial [Colletotrichum paranaense]